MSPRPGQIGLFKILREASPGAGMRRIEAVTLKGVLDRYNSHDGIIAELAKTVNVAESALVKRVDELMKRTRQLEKEIEKMRKDTITSDMDSLLAGAVDAGGVKIISRAFTGIGVDELRGLSDAIRSKTDPAVVLFGSDNGDTALLLFAATANAVKKGIDCGAIIKDAVKCVGGGGGGRKDMAQAGGKNPAGLADAIKTAVARASAMVSS